jgi:formylglycine-generating enzyme required for sulfatase activity
MSLFRPISFSLGITLTLLGAMPVPATERAALIIGNDAYPVRPLKNAVSDATAVRDLLRGQLGFPETGIVFDTNLSRLDIFEKVEAFKKVAADAKIVIVYYAGHGMESLDGKENFLIPVDADIARAVESEAALRATGVNLADLMKDLAEAAPGAKVVLMDCCRDRPEGRGASRAGGGLVTYADDQVPPDTLMILAAAPERQASDGMKHGPFTLALLETLPKGGQNLLDTFFAVSDRVQELTAKRQVPWLKFDGSGRIFREQSFLATVNPLPPVVMRPTVPSVPSVPSVSSGLSSLEGTRAGEARTFGGIEMVWCPPGEFLMGSPLAEEGRSEDEKQVRVTLTRGFWLAKTECTQGQWQAVMGSNPSHFKGNRGPVESVSWDEAVSFCEKLNRESPAGAGWKWSLPTEAQWEYACRAGTETVFGLADAKGSFGVNYLSSSMANFDGNYPYGGGAKREYLEKTAEVGRYPGNAWGLLDMHGNVWEWCADWYGATLPGGMNPSGAGQGVNRVRRGGSWGYDAANCRAAYRFGFEPGYRINNLGVRPALVPSDQ